MHIFLLVTAISCVLYYLSRVALTITMFIRKEHLEEVEELKGFFPNFWAVSILLSYGMMIINLTIWLALVIKTYLL